MARIGLRDLLAAGPRGMGRYTGTLLSVFIVQSRVALACMGAVAIVLANAFATLPIFDEAVDGDLVALLYCITRGKTAIFASAGIVLGAVLLWQLVSWFVAGGIYGVLANRPEGRGETARCFGASGASTYLAYARLALCALPGLLLAIYVLLICSSLAQARIANALSVPELIGPLAFALVPALLVLHVFWTISDYARVELTLRGESHGPGVVVTYLRTIAYVFKRPVTLLHGGLGWLAFALVTVGYMYLSHGHPMYGSEGAITLFVIRQGVALARTAIRFGVMAGQIELGKTRALPPRRAEVTLDVKQA
jgi:hypothetical protein